MKITDYIRYTIDRLPKGYVFTYKDFIRDEKKDEAIIKALNRLAASGKIQKVGKGRFYKPEQTPFGTLQPDQKQILKDLLEKNNRPIGYITGTGIFNQLGFTTQVSYAVQIGRNETRPSLKRGMYTVSFVKQKNTITKENIPLLQLLDVIRFIRKVPDATLVDSCKRLSALLLELETDQQKYMIRLSLKYPPSTRALLGALFENIEVSLPLTELKNSLNPITVYKLSITEDILPTAKNWNIQ